MTKRVSWGQVLAVWLGTVWAGSFWLAARGKEVVSSTPLILPAVKVAASELSESVILPQDSVNSNSRESFVWVAGDGQAKKVAVQVEKWREGYVRVTGLPTGSVVLLAQLPVVDVPINYQLINPEAGQSGVVGR